MYEDGVYRVDFARLQAAGLSGPVANRDLRLANRGRPVATHFEDGGDGRFGPGDSMIFVGEHLPGVSGHYHEYSPFNVYVLSIGTQAEGRRMSGGAGSGKSDPVGPGSAGLRRKLHLERDMLRAPLAGQVGRYGGEALWYWKQVNHLASEPTRVPIDLSNFDRRGESAFSMKVRLRGWSDSASAFLSIPDHVVEVLLNGTPIGRGSWQGRETHTIDIASIPPDLVRPDQNVLGIRVPSRRHGNDDTPLIDVIYLDWIEATFPRNSHLPVQQERMRLLADGSAHALRLTGPGGPDAESGATAISIFGENGFYARVPARDIDGDEAARARVYEVSVPPGEEILWVVPDGHYREPPAIEFDRPSNLAGRTDQRDYFIIAHGSLAKAVEPLARFHEGRGTSTEIVDVQDIYDEFNHGIKHPGAIRAFLAHARDNRGAPAPSLVLLVGDASWYVKEHAEPTAERIRYNERDLIPTWYLRSRDGPAASDNPFVALSGEDVRPDMAIGRFPATRPEEVRAMVSKTIAYMEDPPPGPWRSRVLLASDQGRNLEARNEQLAQRAFTAGWGAREILGNESENPERHQTRLRSAVDEGMLILHFFGHGGRFMWQMAPSRGGNAGNLFDMEDLDRLQSSKRLPIVLSMSCNTGPFDHPAADSLAEKFLRMEERGAVAVVAASARNTPSLKFTNALMDGLVGEDTVGAAILAAKSVRMHPGAALLYNLFGDPGLVPARPQLHVSLEITGRNPLEVEAVIPDNEFNGQAHVEWVSESGKRLPELRRVDSRKLRLRAPQQSDGMSYDSVTIYVWDPESGLDGSGAIALDD